MKYGKTSIDGVYTITPNVFKDDRGYFFESFKEEEFRGCVGDVHFVQENQSKSSYGVLRGLHYQKGDAAQAKLVRVVQGSVLDVAVDIRKSSLTFGKYVAVELSEHNHKQLFIPRGFAHGFLVLSETAVFCYKVDNVYAPQADAGIRWDDPDINIQWPERAIANAKFSEKDMRHPYLKDAEVFD